MMKKIAFFVLLFLLVGCGSKTTIKNGDSKTYSFFKNFNTKKYYVSFWDRNTSINDDTKIIMARDDNKYYYEFDGYQKNIIIQKDGKRYDVNPNEKNYFVSQKEYEDFSYGILPSDIGWLKKAKYEAGVEKIYNKKYSFEKFTNGSDSSIYYFNGKKLIYIKHISIQNTVLLRFNFMKFDFSSKIFEINKDFTEITY